MNDLPYWNHNAAYYPWVKKQLGDRRRILDVGCGDGTLVRYLSGSDRTVTGIDISPACIKRAAEADPGGHAEYLLCPFAEYRPDRLFDAVLFVASLHHMDMPRSLAKASDLLTKDGKLLVVGLASPSCPADRLIELCRIVPAGIGSLVHAMKSPEELGIPTCGRLPEMAAVRDAVSRQLPGAVLRRGLYWRYLLVWQKG